MNQKNRSWIIWVGGIALLLCWGYGMSKQLPRPNPQPVALSSQPGQVENPGPRFGDFTIDVNEIRTESDWSPAVKNDSRTVLDEYHPLTKGVGWLIRIDKDPNKVYPMPPIDAPGKHFFDYTNMWTYIQWGLIPGTGKAHGKFTYHVSPRDSQ